MQPPFFFNTKSLFGDSLIGTGFDRLVNAIPGGILVNDNGFLAISIHFKNVRTNFNARFTTNAFIRINNNTHELTSKKELVND